MMKKCTVDPSSIIITEKIQIKDNLSREESSGNHRSPYSKDQNKRGSIIQGTFKDPIC